nr:hypothetical protein [uncultured Porphyromonas sp.]
MQALKILLVCAGVVAIIAMPNDDADMSFALYAGIAIATKAVAFVAFMLAIKIDKRYGQRKIN